MLVVVGVVALEVVGSVDVDVTVVVVVVVVVAVVEVVEVVEAGTEGGVVCGNGTSFTFVPSESVISFRESSTSSTSLANDLAASSGP